MEQVARTKEQEKSQVQSVLLLTDGLANQGITYKSGILDQMEKIQNEGVKAVDLSRGQSVPHSQTRQAPPPASPSSRGGILSYLFNWGRSPGAQQTPAEQQQQTSASTAGASATKAKKKSGSNKVLVLA